MLNPYESPAATSFTERREENRRILIAIVPFVIAAIAIPISIASWFWRANAKDAASVVFGVVGAVLVFDLPVCAMVIIKWLRAGHPPDLNLSPLLPSREEREFRSRLRQRPRLDDDAFFAKYFAAAEVPGGLPGKLRKTLEDVFGQDFASLDPDDNLVHADWEMDWGDVIVEIEDAFQIEFPLESLDESITFRSLAHSVAQALQKNSGKESTPNTP